ncbi:hypothetical protein [Roseibium sp. Sym1]|uniref:hypothetical protein n=1 Tax=Roseibium sp. Sym1 TaxID=3016006 RepID=UPI0022B4FBA6|nr:hypothetical protein [Roseibium sp. Sym1]
MIRLVLAAALATVALPAQAQTDAHHAHGAHTSAMQETAAPVKAAPREPGQSAFAAIQEIVALLDADPQTDWSAVDIAALRSHLVDMSNVTLHAKVQSTLLDDGYRFVVTGDGGVRDSIQRMVTAHAATMGGVRGFSYETETTPDGAVMIVRAGKPSDLQMLAGLGFIGVMTLGAHHQEHHLAIASGHSPHD